MADPVNPRRYDASRRRAAAAGTRAAILAAARALFVEQGYAGTTIAQIAGRARVSPDTVYASVGTKPALFALLIETALSGRDEIVAGEHRDYAVAIRAAPDAATKLASYAAAVTAIQQRLAPLFLALRAAAPGVPQLDQLWAQITDRRARNMRALAADLASTGELRTDLTVDEVADIIWTMNGSEYYALLVLDRGWPAPRFQQWLNDAWSRLLLS